VTVSGLLEDNEYAVRARAVNGRGSAEWSEELVAQTAPEQEAEGGDVEIPPAWLELRPHIQDLLKAATKAAAAESEHSPGVSADWQWQGLVDAMRRHQDSLKLFFRFYSLLASTDANPNDMSMTQFRNFAKDAHVMCSGMVKADIDNQFVRANRELEQQSDAIDNSENDNNRLVQYEFVQALLRIAVIRAQRLRTPNASSLGGAFSDFVEHADRFVHFDVTDEISTMIKSRAVKAVRIKYEDHLSRVFNLFSRNSAAAKARGAPIKAAKAAPAVDSMNLGELMTMLKEAKIFDNRCTPREVTTFFVLVNIDDELRASGPGDGADELTFSEFWEISARICNEQVPRELRGDSPFELTLDSWLCLNYLPRLEAAAKRREQTTPGSRGQRGSVSAAPPIPRAVVAEGPQFDAVTE